MDHNRKKSTEKNTTPSLYRENVRQMSDKIERNPLDFSSLSDEELKLISQSWSPEEWEQYLSTLEVHFDEELFEEPTAVEEFSSELALDQIFYSLKERHPERRERFEMAVRRIMRKHLSSREFQVVWRKYWEDMTLRAISRDLDISLRSVRTLLERAHEKMQKAVFLESLKKSKILRDLD